MNHRNILRSLGGAVLLSEPVALNKRAWQLSVWNWLKTSLGKLLHQDRSG